MVTVRRKTKTNEPEVASAVKGGNPTTAEYAGAISRWCTLNGLVPDVSMGLSKIAAEFEACDLYLSGQPKNQRERAG